MTTTELPIEFPSLQKKGIQDVQAKLCFDEYGDFDIQILKDGKLVECVPMSPEMADKDGEELFGEDKESWWKPYAFIRAAVMGLSTHLSFWNTGSVLFLEKMMQ